MVCAVSFVFTAHAMTCALPQTDGNSTTIFSGIDFQAQAGDIIDITGRSGCGKSTLLTGFARLHPYVTGDLTLHGKPASDYSPAAWRAQVAYVPQQAILTGDNVREALRMPFTLRIRRERAGMPTDEQLENMLDKLGCADIELSRPVHELSGGQAARISLARTLLTKPAVLLADEVDAALDAENAHLVSQILLTAAHEEHTAILRVRHTASDGIATRTLLMDSEGLHDAN